MKNLEHFLFGHNLDRKFWNRLMLLCWTMVLIACVVRGTIIGFSLASMLDLWPGILATVALSVVVWASSSIRWTPSRYWPADQDQHHPKARGLIGAH